MYCHQTYMHIKIPKLKEIPSKLHDSASKSRNNICAENTDSGRRERHKKAN